MRVRFASVNDAAAIASIYATIVNETAISFETVAPDADEMRARIAKAPDLRPWIVCEREGVVVGYAYASEFRARPAYRWTVEVTIYVRDGERRSGIARTLYTALIALLTAQGYHRAIAGISVPNDASIGFHRALGFTEAGEFKAVGGKFGAWVDLAFWERLLAPAAVPGSDPLAVTELDAQAVAAILRDRQ